MKPKVFGENGFAPLYDRSDNGASKPKEIGGSKKIGAALALTETL